MPRRKESGPGRRGSARSGEGKSFSGTSGKSFKKSDPKKNPKSADGRKTSGKRNFSSPPSSAGKSPRPYRKPDEAGRSFSKRTGTRDDAAPGKRSGGRGGERPFRRSDSTQDDSAAGFSKKSRFAKPSGKPASFRPGSASRKNLGDGPPSRRDAPDRKFQKRPGTPDSKKSFPARGKEGTRRSDSFGKPYKKTYRKSSEEGGGSDTGRPRKSIRDEKADAPKSDKVRLNKFIANSGISSRREADELITMGLISVNGTIVSELGYKVSPGDEVRYEDKVLRAEKPVYILMNKPKGFLTTTDDPQDRKTVMHIIGSAVRERIYPVGRLDRNTTGLLLLTNDGDLADKLMHPSFNVKKIYKVELDRPLTKADFQAVLDGVRLEEGKAVVDELAIVSDDNKTLGVEIHIGWNRVVRRIFENLGYEVQRLDRTAYAGLDKKELARGQWRFLSKEEIIHLKHFK